MVHFRREKYIPHGGPDGGDGGRGGDVILKVDPQLNTLQKFRRQRHYSAEDGSHGGPKGMTGKDGEDLLITVPPGTLAYEADTGNLIGDLVDADDELVILRGGRGGRGNRRFATPSNQAPRMAERGEPGEKLALRLELRLIADVGIIGVPNAGKSTLLAAVTNAKPKIGAYPFTTLQPNLGVVEMEQDLQLILADIPGLIEGASEGVGLGSTFLRHIMRTKVLIHLIDGAAEDPLADYSQVNSELAYFDQSLTRKPQVVAVNKMDLPQVQERFPDLESNFKELGVDTYPISALSRTGLREVLWAAKQQLDRIPDRDEPRAEGYPEDLPIYRPKPELEPFEIQKLGEGVWRIVSDDIERAAEMTYWEYDEAVRRFQHMLDRLGVTDRMEEFGVQQGDTVLIGEYELEWHD